MCRVGLSNFVNRHPESPRAQLTSALRKASRSSATSKTDRRWETCLFGPQIYRPPASPCGSFGLRNDPKQGRFQEQKEQSAVVVVALTAVAVQVAVVVVVVVATAVVSRISLHESL